MVYDDDLYVTDNDVVRSGLSRGSIAWAFTTFRTGNWHPLTWLSHLADVTLFGLEPHAHHAVSVLWHGLASVLCFLALRGLTGALWPSALAAALFAVHPLRVESVAWVAERKDLLAGFFWMVTTALYVRYARRPGPGRRAAVFAGLAFGLMAKPTLVTLPFVFLLLDWWPLNRTPWGGAPGGARPATLLSEKLPLFALSALSSVVTYLAQSYGGNLDPAQTRLALRAANARLASAAYLADTAVPRGLSVVYPYPAGMPGPPSLAAAALLLGAVSVVALLGLRRRPWVATGWLLYLGTLVPVIGLVQAGFQSRADRYTYLPLIGIFAAVAWTLRELWRRRGWRAPLAIGASAAVVLLAALTWAQTGRWHDSGTLFRHALDVTRDNWVAHMNLGNHLARRGRFTEAAEHYREVIRIRPGHMEAHVGLGVSYSALGRLEEEVRVYERATAIDPRNSKVLTNLGLAYQDLGRVREARETLARAGRLAQAERLAERDQDHPWGALLRRR